jgi:hypothetical protein
MRTPKIWRDKRQEHSGAVEHDTKERHEQNEADDGSDHVRDRDRQRAVSHRNRAVVSRPGGWHEISPLGRGGFATRNLPSAGLTDRLRLSRRDRALLP